MGLLMSKFTGFPTPIFDETFSSWLFRCSLGASSIGYDRHRLQVQPSWWLSGTKLHIEDPDFDFTSEFAQHVAEALDLDLAFLKAFFSSGHDDIVDWTARQFFCPECLRSDIAQWRLPGWRKSWCATDSVHCAEHRCELMRLRITARYSKAWDSFVQICNEDIILRRWGDPRLARCRESNLTRIQVWIRENNKTGQQRVLLFRKLYRVFLQSPHRSTLGGAARLLFQSRSTPRMAGVDILEDSIALGASTADVSSRFGSLMMVGMLLGVIPLGKIERFFAFGKSANLNWSLYGDFHKHIFLPSVDRQGCEYLHHYLGVFDREKWPHLDRFLQKQEKIYMRDGVYGGTPFGIDQS